MYVEKVLLPVSIDVDTFHRVGQVMDWTGLDKDKVVMNSILLLHEICELKTEPKELCMSLGEKCREIWAWMDKKDSC